MRRRGRASGQKPFLAQRCRFVVATTMRVLVLGAKGMLGRSLVEAFAPDDVVAWDIAELDITDAAQVEEKLPAATPDVVINAAAYTNVDRAEDEPETADAVNGHAVGVLARTCAQHGIPLLHVSTDYVFSGDQPEGYHEDDDPTVPLSAYGRSKLLGEKLLGQRAKKFWLVRASWLFGPSGKHFVDAVLRLAATKSELRVVADQHGSPTYAVDLAAAIATLVRERAPFGVYHLTNSGVTTWADFARAIFKHANLKTRVVPIPASEYPSKATRPQWSMLLNTKRPPLRPWQEALREYIALTQSVRA